MEVDSQPDVSTPAGTADPVAWVPPYEQSVSQSGNTQVTGLEDIGVAEQGSAPSPSGIPLRREKEAMEEELWAEEADYVMIIEKELSNHITLRNAEDALGKPRQVFVPRAQVHSAGDLLRWLRAAGFHPESKSHWERLGLSPEGSAVDRCEVLRSQRMVTILLKAIKDAQLDEEAARRKWEMLEAVDRAVGACLQDLADDISAPRRHSPIPKVGELDQKTIIELTRDLQDQWPKVWGTQLSRVMDDFSHLIGEIVWTRERLGSFVSEVIADPAAWATLPGDMLMTWPLEPATMGRLMTSLTKQPRSIPTPKRIGLVLPCKQLWGCSSVELIKDLWSTPWLSKNWASHVKRIKFLQTPSEYISAGNGPPSVSHRNIVLLTMAPFGEVVPDAIWKGPSASTEFRTGIGIRLECLKDSGFQIRRRVEEVKHFLGGEFDPEEMVPGLTGSNSRMVLHISAQAGKLAEMDIQACIRKLRRRVVGPGVFLSSDTIFNDPSALLLEVSHPLALEKAWELCEEMVTLSKSTSLIRTSADKASWEKLMEDLYQTDRKVIITKIRERRSIGGAIWLQPMATSRQLSAIRAIEGPPKVCDQAKASIRGSLSQSVGHLNKVLLADIFSQLQHKGLSLRQIEAEDAPQAGTWKPHLTSSFGDLTGGFSILLANEEDAALALSLLSGMDYTINGVCVRVLVSNDLQTAKTAKNCLDLRRGGLPSEVASAPS